MTTLHETRFESPIGEVIAWRSADGVAFVAFAEREEWARARLRRRWPDVVFTADPQHDVQQRLSRYFAGDGAALDDLPRDPGGTAFQRRVWERLRTIPRGETSTYGELARTLNTSARAVGAANGQNPLSLLVPCHRVVGAGGALTGYAFGIARKRWLLEHERAD